MSSNENAKQKLMESMRLTKAGADMKTEDADTTQSSDTQESKPDVPAKRVTTTKKAATPKRSTTVKKAPAKNKKSVTDPFQSSRRVWPD